MQIVDPARGQRIDQENRISTMLVLIVVNFFVCYTLVKPFYSLHFTCTLHNTFLAQFLYQQLKI
jgi:hypothetical protein